MSDGSVKDGNAGAGWVITTEAAFTKEYVYNRKILVIRSDRNVILFTAVC
jgi:hypothetical protein